MNILVSLPSIVDKSDIYSYNFLTSKYELSKKLKLPSYYQLFPCTGDVICYDNDDKIEFYDLNQDQVINTIKLENNIMTISMLDLDTYLVVDNKCNIYLLTFKSVPEREFRPDKVSDNLYPTSHIYGYKVNDKYIILVKYGHGLSFLILKENL